MPAATGKAKPVVGTPSTLSRRRSTPRSAEQARGRPAYGSNAISGACVGQSRADTPPGVAGTLRPSKVRTHRSATRHGTSRIVPGRTGTDRADRLAGESLDEQLGLPVDSRSRSCARWPARDPYARSGRFTGRWSGQTTEAKVGTHHLHCAQHREQRDAWPPSREDRDRDGLSNPTRSREDADQYGAAVGAFDDRRGL